MRRYWVRGTLHDVEFARRQDGREPARLFLEELRAGQWRQDSATVQFPDAAQVKHHASLAVMVSTLAAEGLPTHQRAVNYLQDGLWELKIGTARLSFYDTTGNGICSPKPRITDQRQTEDPDDPYWWFPRFDRVLRVGHVWSKDGDRAHPQDIAAALDVRQEDLAHDRTR